MSPNPYTIRDILHNPSLRHTLFPITAHSNFLAHAAVAPLCAPAAEAMRRHIQKSTTQQQEDHDLPHTLHNLRQTIAHLLHTHPNHISLLGPTSLTLNLIALGLDWRPGDEVIYYPHDYPSNVYPWLNLSRRGVRPIPLHPTKLGQITPDLVLSAITPRTRLIALSTCHYLSGYLIDYQTISKALRQHHPHVLLSLDAIQSLGIAPLDASYVDFISADSHKWLLGPLSAGLFYTSPRAAPLCQPPLLGSWNVHSPHLLAQPTIHPHTDGRRYEPGTLNLCGSLGMAAAIDLLTHLHIPTIRQTIHNLLLPLAQSLAEKGWHVPWLDYPPHARSGILTITHPRRNLPALPHHLHTRHSIPSLRHRPHHPPRRRRAPPPGR
ncbi:MAG: aminotransferase class V-fold PLP-dependent enzyme, partial [Methylacidiphilales bacterium]|nr:aminotransferase class V-fold PLP-dependent enzyme [Candidatus Methylacidiphilales bacterium]